MSGEQKLKAPIQDKEGDEGILEAWSFLHATGVDKWVLDKISPMFAGTGIQPEAVIQGVQKLAGESEAKKHDEKERVNKLEDVVKTHDEQFKSTKEAIENLMMAFAKKYKTLEIDNKALTERIATLEAEKRAEKVDERLGKLEIEKLADRLAKLEAKKSGCMW